MQRALNDVALPALSVPMPFLLAAPYFAIAASLLLVWQGEAALVSRWTPVTLALTHLVVLGFLTMTIAGALFQLLLVAAGAAGPLSRCAWGALVVGTALLAGALGFGLHSEALRAAAGLLGIGACAFLGAIGAAIVGRAPPAARALVEGVRYAAAALAITVALGATLALYLGGVGVLNAPQLTDIHAAWGLVGWVVVLTATVSFRVLPLFQGTTGYPPWMQAWAPALVFVLLSGWTAAGLLEARWWRLGCEIGIALVVLQYVLTTLLVLRRQRKPDAGTRFWQLSMACLLLAVLLRFVPVEALGFDPGTRALLIGVLVVVGCAVSAVNGMLYKIVPFLVWFHLQDDTRLARARIPTIKAILGEDRARRQWRWHLAGFLLLLLAPLAPGVLARPAGLFLLVSMLLLVRDMGRATVLYVRLRHG